MKVSLIVNTVSPAASAREVCRAVWKEFGRYQEGQGAWLREDRKAAYRNAVNIHADNMAEFRRYHAVMGDVYR